MKNFVKIFKAIDEKDLLNTSDINDDYLNFKSAKFVPASGSASRMFNHLYTFLYSKIKTKELTIFLDNINKFAFYEDIKDEVNKLNQNQLIEYILKSGLNYIEHPKALIKMHSYNGFTTNAIDEHIYEAKQYLDVNNSTIHFTISPNHEKIFLDYIESIKEDIENIKIEYSFQDRRTDALALDENNNPIILDNGEVLYRPAGHGALLENLNSLDSDLIFIKNIDNVCHRSHIKDTIFSKKKLASIGINLNAKIDKYIDDIHKGTHNIEEIICFIKDVLLIEYKDGLDSNTALKILDRPLRVCGVVQNQGEPGGGPFLVDDGEFISPQIVEYAEIDMLKDKEVFKHSKYFNPVDMVCFVRRYNGDKYNLEDYVNYNRYMVVEKTYEGRTIKYKEKPGLWNGSMHYWNTVFVEISRAAFNPVKTVNDLLIIGHQPKE